MRGVFIVDYGYGNLHSITKAVEVVAQRRSMPVWLSNDVEQLNQASHIILPGVGAFGDCMDGLNQRQELKACLTQRACVDRVPFLGICVGMQLLADTGHEHGTQKGLGWIAGDVVPMEPTNGLKIPHMGWNEICPLTDNALLKGFSSEDHMYFVHSFHFKCADDACKIASVDYGEQYTAVIAQDNIYGVQFHPEKSHTAGLRLLANFLDIGD